ncbi:MAG: class I SAM-dependent methyltransferase [Nostoc sp.]|uniref:class I SAM-dependent methyltransferase n=1 Tax=Nostoc sp. TaxID=1180 RepID=UPI002FF1C047
MNNQPIDSLKNLNCLCQSNSYILLYTGIYNRQISNYPFSLYRCKTCKLVRVFPIPDISLYTEGYSKAESGEYLQRDKPWCVELANEVERILSFYPYLQGKPILDVGCNGGELVEQLNARHIPSEGCDIDPLAINYGIKKNLSLFLQDLSSQPLDKKYGIVIMNHTLEHIVLAIDVIKNICNALIPGGILHIHVPNYNGWISKIMKDNWGFLVPHEHVWNFTPQTLKFHVESSLPGKVEAVEIRCSTNLEPIGTGVKGLVKGSIIFMATNLNQGDEIIATFRKIST